MAGDAATAEELAGLIGVSAMTIYRDVSILEDCGVLRRNRGRIVAVVNGLHALDAIFRVEQGSEEKRVIARAGASLVAPGSSVLLDDSSAGVWLFRSLDRVDTLTIVTNSLLIANQAIAEKVSGLVIIGGGYRPWAHSSMGSITMEALKRITTDYCFLSAPGIVAMSCVHPYEEVAEVKRTMLRGGERVRPARRPREILQEGDLPVRRRRRVRPCHRGFGNPRADRLGVAREEPGRHRRR